MPPQAAGLLLSADDPRAKNRCEPGGGVGSPNKLGLHPTGDVSYGRAENHRAVFKWRGDAVRSEEIRLQGHTASPIVFDLDGNGTLDILSVCKDGNIYWLLREWILR